MSGDRGGAAVVAAGALVRGRVVVISLDEPDREVELPPSVVRVLAEVLDHAGRGEPVRVVADNKEITTGHAADLLEVSRPYLVGLVDGGEIPSRKVGTRRRLRLADVLLYREIGQARRLDAVRDLAAEARSSVCIDLGPIGRGSRRQLVVPGMAARPFMRLAIAALDQARWSDRILDECFTNLAANRLDIRPGNLDRTRTLMNVAIPDAIVTGDERLVDGLDLPDADRHVVATAIRSCAMLIVTAYLTDLPPDVLPRHGNRGALRFRPQVGPPGSTPSRWWLSGRRRTCDIHRLSQETTARCAACTFRFDCPEYITQLKGGDQHPDIHLTNAFKN
ncbi:MAG: excisionase family DNA-binding protein [Actinomycetota bacterium]|nr:excisionase family DNA-binding protein [Actinomycetota bacterium]MDQ6945429.1 excisionase family DNA-binding protein [Actinomycetota bacterium]